MVFNVEKEYRKVEKRKLTKENEILAKRILELEKQGNESRIIELEENVKTLESNVKKAYEYISDLENQVNSLNEINKELNVTCTKLTQETIDHLNLIEKLEDDKSNSMTMFTLRNSKLKRMFTMGKYNGDRRGLGFNNFFNHKKDQSIAFVKG